MRTAVKSIMPPRPGLEQSGAVSYSGALLERPRRLASLAMPALSCYAYPDMGLMSR